MNLKKLRILIVGGFAAGPSAAAKAKRTNPQADVKLFEASESISYAICEAPYLLSGMIDDESKLVVYTPEEFEREKGVTVATGHIVERIIPSRRLLAVRDLRSRSTFEEKYDKLVIATGSSANMPVLPGIDGWNIFSLKNREDTVKLLNFLEKENPRNAVIIGGGYIGMEIAESLRSRNLEVTMLHQFDLPMEGLEIESRRRISEELLNNGVGFIPDVRTEAFQQDLTGRVKHVLTNRGAFPADLVILSTGVRPNAALAGEAGIRLGPHGGILTDHRQRTSLEDIYAAGDCCEVKNIVSGRSCYLPLATIASRTGWVAGENAAGGRSRYDGAIRSMAVKIFSLQVAQVGIGSEEAAQLGYKVVTSSSTASSRNRMMPGGEDVFIKYIIDSATGRLLGANLFSCCGAFQRANALAVAVQQKMTIQEISRLDLIYAPPFSPLWDPILISANQAVKKIR